MKSSIRQLPSVRRRWRRMAERKKKRDREQNQTTEICLLLGFSLVERNGDGPFVRVLSPLCALAVAARISLSQYPFLLFSWCAFASARRHFAYPTSSLLLHLCIIGFHRTSNEFFSKWNENASSMLYNVSTPSTKRYGTVYDYSKQVIAVLKLCEHSTQLWTTRQESAATM